MKKWIVITLSLLICQGSFAQNNSDSGNPDVPGAAPNIPTPSSSAEPDLSNVNTAPAPNQQPAKSPVVKSEPVTPPPATPSSSTAKKSRTTTSAPAQDSRLKVNEQGKIQLDFINAEISDIAQSIGELTKRNFIIDDKVRGNITIISPQPVTIAEGYQAFVSALEVKGFTITKVGQVYKIVPLREMNKLPIPTDVDFPAGGGDSFVTKLIPLKNSRASELSKAVKYFLSKNGDVITYDPTNTLIVTDSVSNLRRISQIIERLDVSGYQESINIVKLQYAPVVETSEKIKKILDLGGSSSSPAAGGDAAASIGFQYLSKVIPDERTNSLIIVSSTDGYKKISDIVKKLDLSAGDQSSSGRIHVHYLNYADAVELATTLSGVSSGAAKQGSSSSSGSSKSKAVNVVQPTQPGGAPPVAGVLGGDVQITADEQTNSLIITASSSDYQSLIPVINKLDTRRPQAFVEVMILEVDVDKASELGVSGNLGSTYGNSQQVSAFGATTFGTASSIFLPRTTDGFQGLTAGLRSQTIDVPLGGGQFLTIPAFGALFKALQTSGTVNILSTPNILTRDNMEAEIIVGRKVPFISSQGRDINNQPINQIEREDVALTLRVKPQINSSDEMTMDIFQEIQDIIPGADVATFGPTTSKRSTKTTVLVKNNQTVTLGGLISDRTDQSISKVPLLGDIPLIGWLFRNNSSTKSRLSLTMYITPTIIRSPEDLETVTLRKNIERKDFLQKNQAHEHPGIVNYGLNRNLKAPSAPTPPDSPTSGFLSDDAKK